MTGSLIFILVASLGLASAQSFDLSYTKNMVLGNMPEEVIFADDLSRYYPHLNSALEQAIKASNYQMDSMGAMMAANELLHNAGRASLANPEDDRRFGEALELFSKLAQVINKCNYESYIVLAKNYRVASGIMPSLEPTSLINRVVLEAIKEHGNFCRPKYLQLFHEEYNKIDSDMKSKVDFIANPNVLWSFFAHGNLIDVLRGGFFPEGQVGIQKALTNRLHEARAHESGPIDNKDLTKKYLIEPCQQFKNQFKGIFYPAQVDVALDQSKVNEINPTKDQVFEDNWVKFKLCDAIVYSGHIFESIMDL